MRSQINLTVPRGLRVRAVRALLAVLWIGAWSSVPLHGQTPTAAASLATGIKQAHAGEFFAALFTLDQVVRHTSGRREDSAMLARAHAFRAMVYVGLNQTDRAQAAVMLALEADRNVAISPTEFTTAAVALFADARRPLPAGPEAAGQVAEETGRFQQAFVSYLNAYQALPDPPPAADDRRLREKIIRVVQRLDITPAIPPAAREHATKADALLEAEAVLGGPSGMGTAQASAMELSKAIRLAPWWSEATFKLATQLQRLQRFDEALLNLNLYRLADPKGYGAARDATPGMAVPAAAGPAVVQIYWPPQRSGGGKPKVRCDGHHVADLQNKRFIFLNIPAGSHSIGFHNQSFQFVFEAGRKYFLRASAEGFPPKALVRMASADEATAEIQQEKLTGSDPRRVYSTECTAPAGRPR